MCIALGSDQFGGFEGATARQRGAAALKRCVERHRVGPAQLALGGVLQEAAARVTALVRLAVDALEELIGDRYQNLGHTRSISRGYTKVTGC